MTEICEVNVGGKCFTTLLATLCKYPNSMLAAMFSGRFQLLKDRKGRCFIDRPAKHFELILNFLRTGTIAWPTDETEIAELRLELDYYGLLEYVPHPSKGYVLLVDDNKVNQVVVKRELQRLGYAVIISENGAEALEQYKQHSFDLILMDLMMPVMDGIQATKTIRKLEQELKLPRVPIVSITVLGFIQIETECLAAGTDCHIIKPLRKEDLVRVIHKFLEH
eukprot:TRINITY_DN12708_c0_g1_i1.p1 TRINITY_DN12708_c0_g1~~TRINITY_DN12708_c0_g1_i1.p1  ORF type:complete len:222 (+),score=23.07 TRINITY_DN12708_c0_g1_i1:30-695(+)